MFPLDSETNDPLNIGVADRLEAQLQGRSPLKLRFSDTPRMVYLFDEEKERDEFEIRTWRAKRDAYMATLTEEEIEAIRQPRTIQTRNGAQWLLFWKDCGGNCTTAGEMLCAPDHISGFEERFNPLGVCSAKWEQADMSTVACSTCSTGNWDQNISTITWNIGLMPPQYYNPFTGIYRLGLFRHANFSSNHHCDDERWTLIGWRGNDNPFGTSCCLNHLRWGTWCADMNDSITGWRFTYCHDSWPNIMCDNGCFEAI